MHRLPTALLAMLTLLLFSCGPEDPGQDPPVVCEIIEDRSSCQAEEECGWLIQACGEFVDSACLRAGDVSVATDCRALEALDCHEQESFDTCASEACDWVSPGCGDEDDYPMDGATCMAKVSCSPDGDECPEGLECYPYTWDPCAGSDCDACGAHEHGCFPPLEG